MFVIKRVSDGQYVARAGSVHSYTNDRGMAEEYLTVNEAENNRCDNESIYQSHKETLIRQGQL